MKKQQTEEELLKELNDSWSALESEATQLIKNSKAKVIKKAIPLITKTINTLSKINKDLSNEATDGKGKTNRKK